MSTVGQPAPEAGRSAARLDWEQRVRRRRDSAAEIAGELPAPSALEAEAGGGQVTLRWQPVSGAAGYVVQRAEGPDGPFQTVDHGGGDVLAVPGPSYADTTGAVGVPAWYTVASLAAAEGAPGPHAPPVVATPRPIAGSIQLAVDASNVVGRLTRPWHMVGSEHLSQLFYGRDRHGMDVGQEFAEALRIAHVELGVDRVRAHGILLDELGVYGEADGRPVYDFSGIDRVYDRTLGLGLRPVVELSFMPRALARDPGTTVFDYRAIVSPPKDWRRWGQFIRALAQHLVDRYGISEVAEWGFEVWNEPNLEVFWSGSQSEYFQLYQEAARAIKAVDPRLKVGGPATAAAGWMADFATAVTEQGMPLDFLATHTYGSLPLDVSAPARSAGLQPRPLWWTEWGVSPTHFAPINDAVLGAPFVLHGMYLAMDRIEHLAYWVISDHFEELGRPPALLHGGFGLLTIGNLRKPRFWALRMLEMLGPDRLATTVSGDGAESLVQAIATAAPDGLVQLLVWNGTLDQSKQSGAALLDRPVRLKIQGLSGAGYTVEHLRLDAEHSNIASHWRNLGKPDWPDAAGWARLRAGDRLDRMGPPSRERVLDREVEIDFELPMPAVSLIRLVPDA